MFIRFRFSPLFLLLCTLTVSSVNAAAIETTIPDKSAARVSAKKENITAAQKGAIDSYVNAEMNRQHIPGATVGIFRHGNLVYSQGYGYANLEWQIKMRPDTIMQSGSVGKQFTATAVLMLVEQGKVGLEDSIRKYFPESPETWQAIKVKNLLSHSSGLAEYETPERGMPGAVFDLRADFSEDQLVKNAGTMPIDFAPGDKFAYSNTNYMLLGILIHRVSGQFYGDYMQDHIFHPLGMDSTHIISDRDIVKNRASGYEVEINNIKNQKYVSATFNSTGDGALYFNLPDLEKWDRAQYGEKILSSTVKQQMWTPFVLNDGKPNRGNYGFAFFINQVNGHRVIEHTGAWQGFTTMVSRYVDDGLTVVVLTNLDSDHAYPENIERVVAGIVEPELMPVSATVIKDEQPNIVSTVHKLFIETADGRDTSDYFAPEYGYRFDADDAAKLNFSMPPNWRGSTMELISRKAIGDKLESRYRIGKVNNRRIVAVQTTASGKVTAFSIYSDPDNRY